MPNFFKGLFRGDDATQDPASANEAQSKLELDKAIKKASFIDDINDTRDRKTDRLAVTTLTPEMLKDSDPSQPTAAIWGNDSFKHLLQFNLHNDKNRRIQDYRELAEEEKIEGCLHELAITCIASTYDNIPIRVELNGDYDSKVKDIIVNEATKIINLFEMDMRGQEYFSEFLTCGELAFENVFTVQQPELGIIGIKQIPPENIDPFYRNFYNQEIEMFVVKKPNNTDINSPQNQFNQQNRRQQHDAATSFEVIPLSRSQVTYCNSGKWDRNGQYVIPYILKGQRAQRKLSLLEDAIIINALVNAPERLLFTIPTGEMDGPTKDRYMNDIVQQHKKTMAISYDNSSGGGDITSKMNPIGITENFYIPVGADGKRAAIERVAGSNAFGSGFGGMLDYFHQKVYESMHVPISRLNPDSSQSDGTTITMQELAFAERVEGIQKRFAYAIKKTLVTHLKMKGLKIHTESCQNAIILESKGKQIELPEVALQDDDLILEQHIKLVEDGYAVALTPKMKEHGYTQDEIDEILGCSYWNQFGLKEHDITVEFSLPTNFLALREQQIRSIKQDNFNALVANDKFSFWWLAKRELKMTDKDILANHDWNKKEAAYLWELSNIEESGPNFRAIAAEQAGLTGEEGGGGLGGLGGGGGGGLGGSALPAGGGLGGGADVGEFGDDGGALDDLGGGSEAPTGEAPPADTGGASGEPSEPSDTDVKP